MGTLRDCSERDGVAVRTRRYRSARFNDRTRTWEAICDTVRTVEHVAEPSPSADANRTRGPARRTFKGEVYRCDRKRSRLTPRPSAEYREHERAMLREYRAHDDGFTSASVRATGTRPYTGRKGMRILSP